MRATAFLQVFEEQNFYVVRGPLCMGVYFFQVSVSRGGAREVEMRGCFSSECSFWK